MAFNSSSQAIPSTDPQGPTEEVGVTSLISGSQLQQDRNTSTVSTFSRNTDSDENEAMLGSVVELPKSCGFLTLARELRNIIYTDLITSGRVEILRVSRKLHDEAKDLLYQIGICRLRMVCYPLSHPKVRNPTTIPSNDKIQNFNISISIRHSRDPIGSRSRILSSSLQRSIQGSGHCHISLVYARFPNGSMPMEVLYFIRCLRTFELVTLRIHRRDRPIADYCHIMILLSMVDSLWSALGSPEWKSDTCSSPLSRTLSQTSNVLSYEGPLSEAQYLEFHPREKE